MFFSQYSDVTGTVVPSGYKLGYKSVVRTIFICHFEQSEKSFYANKNQFVEIERFLAKKRLEMTIEDVWLCGEDI